MAKESAQKYANLMEKNAIITLDGAWDHRRHGSCCIVTLIDVHDNDHDGVTRKIIEESNWKITEVLDVGHAVKSIKKI